MGRVLEELEVVGAAILRGSRCLVALRSQGMAEAGRWEFPGGKVEAGEAPHEALAREVREELGCDVEVGRWIGRGRATTASGRSIRLDVYLAVILDGEPRAREHAELRWVEAEELRRLDWACADVPIADALATYLESNGRRRVNGEDGRSGS